MRYIRALQIIVIVVIIQHDDDENDDDDDENAFREQQSRPCPGNTLDSSYSRKCLLVITQVYTLVQAPAVRRLWRSAACKLLNHHSVANATPPTSPLTPRHFLTQTQYQEQR